LPTTVLLNAEGMVVHRHVGFELASHRYLEEQIRTLLQPGA
jgi:hypothetical protein